jgi:hypothetical protein
MYVFISVIRPSAIEERDDVEVMQELLSWM